MSATTNQIIANQGLRSQRRWFRTNRQDVKPDVVREADGIIEGVSVVTAGEAKGHDVWLDHNFIKRVVSLGNSFELGVKARFGHPNMSNEALGTYLGQWKNFRLSEDGSKAIADLHLAEVAKLSPNGDLFNWVLGMAKTAPEQLGASIVFKIDKFFFKDKAGNVVDDKTEDVDMEIDLTTGEPKCFVSIMDLLGADIVDEPAANNNGLFSARFNKDSFAVLATEFLDANPDIANWLAKSPEKALKAIADFIPRYVLNKNSNPYFDVSNEIDDASEKGKELEAELEGISADFETRFTQLSERIKKLEELPAGTHTRKNGELRETTVMERILNAPHNQV